MNIPEDIDVTKNIIGHLRMIDKKLNALADYLNVVYEIEYKENTTIITIKEK